MSFRISYNLFAACPYIAKVVTICKEEELDPKFR